MYVTRRSPGKSDGPPPKGCGLTVASTARAGEITVTCIVAPLHSFSPMQRASVTQQDTGTLDLDIFTSMYLREGVVSAILSVETTARDRAWDEERGIDFLSGRTCQGFDDDAKPTTAPRSPSTPDIEISTTPPPLPGHPPAMKRMDSVGAPPRTNGKAEFEYAPILTHTRATAPLSPPSMQPSTEQSWATFTNEPCTSIVATYRSLLQADPDLTMPIAAIESLVLLLALLPPTLSTISETLDLLATSTSLLKRSVPNPISLSAGTDLFQRYLVTTLQRGSANAQGNDFMAIRAHLVLNGRLFVRRAKEARRTIAGYARRFVRDGSVVLTNGGSRVVGAVLQAAAEAQTAETGSPRFKVIYVQSLSPSPAESESHAIVRALRRLSVPVATIPESAVAYSMGKVTMVMVGAEGVVENGGVISRMGTYQMGILAREKGKPCYVVAESHKFVRMFPLGQYDLPIEQRVLDFRTDGDDGEAGINRAGKGEGGRGFERGDEGEGEDTADSTRWDGKTPKVIDRQEYFDTTDSTRVSVAQDAAVDYTPPEYITALITESGVHTPSAVSEELIKIWY